MDTAQLIYRDDADGWWAASPDLPGYSAAGETFEEVRELAREGAPWFAERELELHHLVLDPRAWHVGSTVGARARAELHVRGPRRFSIHASGPLAA